MRVQEIITEASGADHQAILRDAEPSECYGMLGFTVGRLLCDKRSANEIITHVAHAISVAEGIKKEELQAMAGITQSVLARA